MRRRNIVPPVVLVAALAACGSSDSSTTAKDSTPSTGSTGKAVAARPAGVNPSVSAKMVCADEAQKDIARNVGLPAVLVTAPTWIDHTYSCRYVYPNGTFSLSVKELDSEAQTKEYFDALGTQLGRLPDTTALGPDSFLTSNGSLVLRKDWKVLRVDVSHLPAEFGKPAATPTEISQAVGAAIVGCWTGT